MGWNPISEAKKWFKRIENLGKDTIHKIERASNSAVNNVKRQAELSANRVKREAENSVKQVEREAGKAVNAIETAEKNAVNELERQVPDIAEKVLADIREGIEALWTAGILDDLVDLGQQAVKGKKVPLRLSIIEMQVDINSKIDVLQELSHNLPTGRSEIIEMVHKLTDDDTVIVHLDARLVSSALGFDIAIPIPVEKLTTEGDKIFKRFGL